jgi:hypothetical protein
VIRNKTPSLKRDAEVSIYLISKLHQSFPPDIEAAEIRLVISGIYGFSTSRGNRSLLQLYWSKCFRLRYAPDCLAPNQASSHVTKEFVKQFDFDSSHPGRTARPL